MERRTRFTAGLLRHLWRGPTTILATLLCVGAGPALAVDQPPSLVSFTNLTPTIDASAGPVDASFAIGLSDPAPGVCLDRCDDGGTPSQLDLVHPPSGQRHTALLQPNPLGSGYVARITLDATDAGGVWQVDALWLADQSGNRRHLSHADLVTLGYAASVDNLATGGPITPPSPSSLSMTTSFDSSSGAQVLVDLRPYDGSLCLSLACADPSGPSQVRLVHAATGQTRSGLIRRALVFSGGSFVNVYRARIDFPPGSAGGLWTLAWADLVDGRGNRARLDTTALQALGPTTTNNTSAIGDSTPPVQTLVDDLPRPIDSTGGPILALFSVEAFDAGSGLCVDACEDRGSTSQVVYKRDGAAHRRFGRLAADPGAPDVYLTAVTIPPSDAASVWRPDQVMLVDRAGNRTIPEPTLPIAVSLGAAVLAGLGRRRPVPAAQGLDG